MIHVYERLDRCFANVEWCKEFPHNTVYNVPIFYSDHAPILTVSKPNTIKTRSPFKFENWWLLEEDYHDIAKHNWTNTNNEPFHIRTSILAGSLKWWSKNEKPLKQPLDTIHKDLENLQSKPTWWIFFEK